MLKKTVAVLFLNLLGLTAQACGGSGEEKTGVDTAVGDGMVADRKEEESHVSDGVASDPGAADGRITDGAVEMDVWHATTEFTMVTVEPGTPAALQLAVQACAGLHNRELGGSVYVQADPNDEEWLGELKLTPKNLMDASTFLETCVARFPTCVRYSYKDQQRLLPNILTIGAALQAVPLDVEMTAVCGDVVFDATVEFKDKNTPYLATQYVFDSYISQTTGLAMLNPGYNTHDENVADPALTRDMPPALVDFVFSQKLFVVFLVNGCEESHPERDLLHSIVNLGQWPLPLGVYGYNNSWMVMGGYVHEAQTKCLKSRNMGAIPTETSNLSFFSTRRPPITETTELEHTPPEEVEYDPSKTYVAFVIGDGDNVAYMMSARKNWLRQRKSDCEQADHECAPITWSISHHLPRLAPDVLRWYYKSARETGKDYFVLPPSGHFYAYPTSLNSTDRARFAAATEQDAKVLGVSGVVHWDWADTWKDAEAQFLPQYAKPDGAIRGVFPVNVPYMFEAFPWWPKSDFYKIITGRDGGSVVVFRPRAWRGIDNDSNPFFQSPQKMAEELGGYPPGTVTWVYMTSDGGLNLENSFMVLEDILPSHVRLVSADAAARLALTAGNL